MSTNLSLDPDLLERALEVSGERTKKAAVKHGGKPWRYLLIPHDAVVVNATLGALATRFIVRS